MTYTILCITPQFSLFLASATPLFSIIPITEFPFSPHTALLALRGSILPINGLNLNLLAVH
jgi:hypothetical protein